ncbi:cytochrome P450 [soil metagenome]
MATTDFAIPAHVPAALIRYVDPFAIEGGNEDLFSAWQKVQLATPDIYYSPYCGGFWMLNRARAIAEVVADADRFSSVGGVTIMAMPKEVPPFPPNMIDPPDHAYFRKPLNLALAPQKLKILGDRAREIVRTLLDQIVDKGECEFMEEIALHVPVAIVMSLFDLPFSDSARLIPLADTVNRSSDAAERTAAITGIAAYAEEWILKRKTDPGDDLASKFMEVMVGNRPISHPEVVSMMTVLLIGGLDSVSHTMGAIMRFLAENPEQRQYFAGDKARISASLDELLRRHSITSTARVVRNDMVYEGVEMKAGDRIFLCAWLHSLDPEAWNAPMDVEAERRPRDIMTFGRGIHRCVGANLARLEIRTLLEEWLARIPDFSITPGDSPSTSPGQTMATVRLPLSWPTA